MIRFYQKDVESTTEYVLPDYLGDVKKVLSVSAAAIPSGRFAADDGMEFSGVVVYDVVYADADGELTKLSTTSDYDFSVPESGGEYADSIATPTVSNAAVRFTGPRKLVARATVSNSVVLTSNEAKLPEGDAFEGELTPELDERTVSEENVVFTSSAEREYAEEAERIPDISPDGIEIIATSGAVRIYESTAEENGVRVKGELVITSIVKTDEQPPFAIRKSIPFEELITLEGAAPGMQTMSNGYLTSVTSGVSEDADGSLICVNAIAEYSCFAAENKERSVVVGAYLKERDSETRYENVTYPSLVCMGNCECEFSLSRSREELGCEDIREMLSVSCELSRLEKSISAHSAALSGEATVYGISCQINEYESPKYLPFKFTAPFSANVNLGCQIPDGAVLDITPVSVTVSEGIEADSVSFTVTLSAAYHAHLPICMRKVAECNAVGDAEYTLSPSTVTVYYPDAEETLFDVAKKFHTSCGKIASDSGLSVEAIAEGGGVLKGAGRLIIK